MTKKEKKTAEAQIKNIKARPVYDIETIKIKGYKNNARTHSAGQVEQLAASIKKFGFTNPLLLTPDYEIIAGHGRAAAAAVLGLETVPAIILDYLNETEKRAYILADNRLAELAGWDLDLLSQELNEISENMDLDLIGFSDQDLAELLEEAESEEEAEEQTAAAVDEEEEKKPVSRPGELYLLGPHRLTVGETDLVQSDDILHFYRKISGEVPINARTGLKFG